MKLLNKSEKGLEKRDRKLILSVILIATLLITACGQIGDTGDSTRVEGAERGGGIIAEKVYTGTQGLTMNFLENTPPDFIYEDDKMTVGVEVRNLGARKIESESDGYLYLSGFDQKLFGDHKPDGESLRGLEPKSEFNPEGGYTVRTFTLGEAILPKGVDVYPAKMRVTLCYNYQTIANPIVCVDPTIYDPTIVRASECQMGQVNVGNGQGAPVAVTAVQEKMVGKDKVLFTIQISNVGEGTVLLNQGDCQPGAKIDREDLNKLHVDFIRFKGVNIRDNCEPIKNMETKYELRLTDGTATLYCNADIARDTSAYTTPLEIGLGYAYTNYIEKQVEVRNLPE